MSVKLIAPLATLLSATSLADTAQNFEKWSLICGEQGNCSLSQIVTTDPQGKNIILGVNVNYSLSKEFPVLMIRLPPSTHANGGVGLKIDMHNPVQIPISQCAPAACQTIVKIDEVLLEEMRSGTTMHVALEIKEGKQLTLPVSLNGFKQGFEALNKTIRP